MKMRIYEDAKAAREQRKADMRALGRLGGKARMTKLTPEQRSDIARVGAAASVARRRKRAAWNAEQRRMVAARLTRLAAWVCLQRIWLGIQVEKPRPWYERDIGPLWPHPVDYITGRDALARLLAFRRRAAIRRGEAGKKEN